DNMNIFRKIKFNRRHTPGKDPRMAQAKQWIEEMANGPYYIVPTHTWTQQERDKFIVRNHFSLMFDPDHEDDLSFGFLIREFPTFLKTGYGYKRERRFGDLGTAHQGRRSPS
ncbi:unnamed protein product, partial [marine sediment metagenome]